MRGEHRLLRVDDEIEQHLLNLVRVRENRRQTGRERVENDDVRRALFVSAKSERFARDLIEVDHRPGRVPFTNEGLKIAHDARGAFGGVMNGVEIAARGFVEPAAGEAFRAGKDGRERVVQLMRDARHRLPERREFFRL